MVFSSPVFLFLFLPVVLALYFILPARLRNGLLLLASFFFYAWGEPFISGIMLLSILANWAFGLWVDRARASGRSRRVVALAVVFNIGLLVVFKYADWLWSIADATLRALGLTTAPLPPLGALVDRSSTWQGIFVTSDGHIRLPIGISFFTFQALSYVVDVYRREARLQRNPLDLGVYVALFPQLIAGPIVRYKDVAEQIVHRVVTREGSAYGVRRFVIGLGKKVLIANVVAKCADTVFSIPAGEITPPVAWLGIVCYTLQIYFDFSGYSDMAIGLGHLFGFRFLENFAHPYASKTVTEFWRRWHISLSTWFRDYLYVPLGGNRVSPRRTYLNLLVVFFLCGLWHGAAFTFVVWGLYHGAFLVIERVGFARWMERRPAVLRHAYLVLVVMVGWVFFRAPDLPHALAYLEAMLGLQAGNPLAWRVDLLTDPLLVIVLIGGAVGSTPWLSRIAAWHAGLERVGKRRTAFLLEAAGLVGLAFVFLGSAAELSAGSYNPFIYFRF